MRVTSGRVDMHVSDIAGHMAFIAMAFVWLAHIVLESICREEAKSLPALTCVHPLSHHNNARQTQLTTPGVDSHCTVLSECCCEAVV